MDARLQRSFQHLKRSLEATPVPKVPRPQAPNWAGALKALEARAQAHRRRAR
jgi:hypothetical protein